MEKVAEMSVTDMEPGTPYEIVYGNDATCLEELRCLMVQPTPVLELLVFRLPEKWTNRNFCYIGVQNRQGETNSMKAAQITQYNKNFHIKVNDVPTPKMGDYENYPYG